MGRELNILFWNIHRNDLTDVLVELTLENNVDILILSETQNQDLDNLIHDLNVLVPEYFISPSHIINKKIKFITKFDPQFLISLADYPRFGTRKVSLPNTKNIIITGVHLMDQRSTEKDDIGDYAITVKKTIDELEVDNDILDSIVIGDFNLNPFDRGIVKASGFHAVSDKIIAQNLRRTVQGNEYSFFYNPCWQLYGDNSGVPGTYFLWKSTGTCLFWNIFDQVLIRPSLIENFDQKELKIITSTSNHLLLKNDRPNKDQYSDHLPLFIKLKNL